MKATRRKRDEVGASTGRADRQGNASKPISLSPLSFDEALESLLKVQPESKSGPEDKLAQKKRQTKKR